MNHLSRFSTSRFALILSLAGAATLTSACGDGDSIVGPGDAGATTDIASTDSGSTDSGSTDSGSTDAGNHDSGVNDAGNHDAGDHDAGDHDAGDHDASHADGGGHGDAGTPSCATGDTHYTPSGTHWDYAHPDEWAMLSTTYAMCNGMNQTPVDIPATTGTETTPLTFNNYGNQPLRLLNNGHTLQVNVPTTYGTSDPSVTYNGTTYYLLQFHAHTTSEHTVAGTSFPVEMHFVHATDGTAMARYLVVGVMFNVGAESAAFQTMVSENPGDECQRERLSTTVAMDSLLPTNRSFFHYSPGSLTTPPCTEGLNWFVLSNPLTVSMAQVTAFGSIVHGHNNRPVQPLNGRMVTRYTAP